jgi:hypothetical protein
MSKPTIAFVLFLLASCGVHSQDVDSTRAPSFFRGQITATNNGISLVPNFSLGRPAALFDLSLGKGRFSFDPWLRFGLDTKPWVFILWFRYKLINQRKFHMGIGAHPSFLFRTQTVVVGGVTRDITTTERYVAMEATPTFQLSKKVGVGVYYLGGHGLTNDLIQATHFLAVRAILTKAQLGQRLNYSLIPQFYYLQQDELRGTYTNLYAALAMNRSPVSLSANLNWKIKSQIGGDDFLWGVGLVYNIDNEYSRTN